MGNPSVLKSRVSIFKDFDMETMWPIGKLSVTDYGPMSEIRNPVIISVVGALRRKPIHSLIHSEPLVLRICRHVTIVPVGVAPEPRIRGGDWWCPEKTMSRDPVHNKSLKS